jgi:hypothetical protein
MSFCKVLPAAFVFVAFALIACSDDSSSFADAPDNGASEESLSISTTVMQDGPEMEAKNGGHIDLDIPADSFLTVFEPNDYVKLTMDGYGTVIVPVLASMDNALAGELFLLAEEGKPYVTFGMFRAPLAIITGVSRGVIKFPINVEIELEKKGEFTNVIKLYEFQHKSNSIEAYPELSAEEFANFRMVATTGMGDSVLFRASSPIDPQLGRSGIVDSLSEVAGVKVFLNMNDAAEDSVKSFEGFEDSYYAKQKVAYGKVTSSFTMREFKEPFAEKLKFMAENEGPYLVHCVWGKDRTGIVIAVLAALMGATAEEIQDDYAKTYTNFFDVVDDKQVALTKEQKDLARWQIRWNMVTAYEVEGIDISDFEHEDLAAATEKYLLAIGLEKSEIESIKKHLK